MPFPLRSDFDAFQLRILAKGSKDASQARRLLALAAIYNGATRTDAALIGSVTRQIVRDWVLKFNAHGPDGLIGRKPPGQPSQLDDTHRAALVGVIERLAKGSDRRSRMEWQGEGKRGLRPTAPQDQRMSYAGEWVTTV